MEMVQVALILQENMMELIGVSTCFLFQIHTIKGNCPLQYGFITGKILLNITSCHTNNEALQNIIQFFPFLGMGRGGEILSVL